MSSAVQVKPEPGVGVDVFCVDTDSESEDIDIDKLQPLASRFASLSKFPIGCKVWYDLRCSPKTKHMQAKSARVEEVSIHFENGRRVYNVKKSEAADEHEISLYEDQLVYGISCPVRVTKVGTDEALDGVVVYLQRGKGSDGRRQVTYAVQYSTENFMTIESGVAADRIKYRAEDCGVGGDGNDGGESNISIDKQKRTTCTAAAAAVAKRRSPSTESSPFGSDAPLKASGADLIRSHIEGDAKELKELSSAQTDSASVSASIPAAISPAQKDETKSEEGKSGAKIASAVVGDKGILTMQKNKEKKRTRKKKSKKQHIAAQASNHSMTAAGDMPLPQEQTQAEPTSSIQKQKQKPCTQEGDTDKEQRAADDSSHTSSVESLAQAEGNDHNSCNQSNSHDAIRRIPRKRSSGSDSNANPHPSKVAKRDNSVERADARGDSSKGKAENTAAVRILTIPYWWRKQWGQEHRRQLYSRLIGKATVIKSSTNCTVRISGHDTNERMRITIESLSRDPKSQLNSLRHANCIIENILIECLADENSKMRLLYDLALSDLCQLIHRDSSLLLLQKEILSSQSSKSKEWWHLYELPCGREMHLHDLSSIRLKLPKESDCKIEVFGRSVKVSRESPYVLVSGTKQRDVKSAAMMVANAVQRHPRRFLPCPPKPKRS